MPSEITETKAIERSTCVITVSFTDEDGSGVTPNEVSWTLMDLDGNIINTRESIDITPGSSVEIVLYGNDLVVSGDVQRTAKRVLLLEGTYDSDIGNDLPFRDQLVFAIDNLVNPVVE